MDVKEKLAHNTQHILHMVTHTMAHDLVKFNTDETSLKDDIALRIYFMMIVGRTVMELHTEVMITELIEDKHVGVFQDEQDLRSVYAKMLNISMNALRALIKEEIVVVRTQCMKKGADHDPSKH